MKWKESSKIIKEAWGESIAADDTGYYKPLIEEAIKNKKLFLKAAKKFGTPLYILDEKILEKKALYFMNTFRKQIPASEYFYALKSNDLPYLVKRLGSYGYYADVAGIFELQLALKLGFKKIIFTGPGKSLEELNLAIKNNDKVIVNIDNTDELDRIVRLIRNKRKQVNISIRINPDSLIMKTWSKFGVDLMDLKKTILKVTQNKKLILVGLHFHSSWNETPERYCRNIKLIGNYLKKHFTGKDLASLEFLDIGGGIYPEDQSTLTKFSHRYALQELIEERTEKSFNFDISQFYLDETDELSKFAKKISEYVRKYILTFKKNLKICFEPGRYISNNSTHVLLTVIAEKNKNVITDGGMNLIGGLDFYNYLYSPIINLSKPALSTKKKIIYGSLCKADDLWGYSYFGTDCKKGDMLIVLMQGSYTFSRAWRFLKETAPYIIIKKNKLILAKQKEKFNERYSGCKF